MRQDARPDSNQQMDWILDQGCGVRVEESERFLT